MLYLIKFGFHKVVSKWMSCTSLFKMSEVHDMNGWRSLWQTDRKIDNSPFRVVLCLLCILNKATVRLVTLNEQYC